MIGLIKFMDRHVGEFVCSFLGLFNKDKKIENPAAAKKILIIQLWGIGETILTLPAIEALRKRFPNSDIDALTTQRNKDVYFGNKKISKVITIKLNPFSWINFILKNMKKYDLVIDMEEYLNASAIMSFFIGKNAVGYSHGARANLYNVKVKYNDGQHAVQTFLDLARALGADYNSRALPKLNFSAKDKKFVDLFFKRNKLTGRKLIVCVSPGAAESAKARIWPIERYSELCDEIIQRHDAKIIFIGGASEEGMVNNIQNNMDFKGNSVNSAGKISLIQLFYLVGKCKIFIGNDSGPMHVAAAQKIKTIGLFGPNLPVRFGPYGEGNLGLYKGYNCEFSPCINVHKGQVPDCVFPKTGSDYQKCMKNIGVGEVLREVETMLKQIHQHDI